MKKLSVLTTFLPILGLILGGCATPNQPVGQQLQETSQAHYQGTDDTQSQLTESSKLAINGIGPIRVGMTLEEAEKAAGTKLISMGPYDQYRSYVKPQSGPDGVYFMVVNNRIATVDIDNPRMTTVGGAKIGDTEERIKAIYPGQIEVSRHEDVHGYHFFFLTFVPKDAQDQQYRVVFQTDGNRVTGFRAGQLPEVEYVELS